MPSIVGSYQHRHTIRTVRAWCCPNLDTRVLSYPSRRVEERTWERGCVMSMMLHGTSVEMLHKTQNFAPFDPKCWYKSGFVCRAWRNQYGGQKPTETSVIRLQWRIQTFRWEGGHPYSKVTRGGAGLKKIFSAPRASFSSKNNGGRAPGPPPLEPPLDCYHSPSELSRGRACNVRASAFALRADKKHATCSPAQLWWTPNIPSPSFEVGYEKVNSSLEELINIRVTLFAPVGFRPRGRNPRRHPNVPRVKKKYRIVVVLVCEKFSIWWN